MAGKTINPTRMELTRLLLYLNLQLFHSQQHS